MMYKFNDVFQGANCAPITPCQGDVFVTERHTQFQLLTKSSVPSLIT